jgi:hypothetical protein
MGFATMVEPLTKFVLEAVKASATRSTRRANQN